MILIRDFANTSEAEMLNWLNLYLPITVEDDHGEVLETNTYDMMISWYSLQIHKRFDGVPYSVKEIVNSTVYNDGSLQKVINHLLTKLMEDIDDPVTTDYIKQLLFAWKIKLNNFLSVFGGAGFVSATAECVVEVMDDPGIIDIKSRIKKGLISIDAGESEFKEYILHTDTLKDNIFVLLCRTGGVSINQAYQTVVIRGSVFDLNKRILPNSIDSSYAEGIVNLADSLGEKCAAGMSLISNGKALQDSEWLHRKLHTVTNTVVGLDFYEDCGTTVSIPIKIKSHAHIVSLQGKFSINEDGTLTLIKPSNFKNWKNGDNLYIRSTAFCNNLRSGKPCKICVGKMKAAVPYNSIMGKVANLGMFSSTAILKIIGQLLLSTKHFLKNSVTIPFEVTPDSSSVIRTADDQIYLAPKLSRPGTKLILDRKIISELSDLKNLESLSDVNEAQLRSFSTATFEYEIEDPMVGGTTVMQKTVNTSVSTRVSKMSTEFINYVIDVGWENKDKKFISIDLSNLDGDTPIFFMPSVHEDLDVYRREFESFVTFSKRNKQFMESNVTPEVFGQVLTEFWMLIDKKLKDINVLHAEVILSSLLCRDPDNGYYRFPEYDEPRYFRSFNKCIYNRGMGGLLIYQDAHLIMESVDSFLVKERQPAHLECYWQLAVK